MTGPFQQIARGFIWWAGITRPKQGKEAMARNYILGILAGTGIVLCTMFFVLQQAINR